MPAEAADFVRRALLAGAELRRSAAEVLAEPLARAAEAVASRLASGGIAYFLGNGGSASQAQHFAAELTGRFKIERQGLAGIALGTNASELTGVANDYGYAVGFERPLAALVRSSDAVIGLSGSGGSDNVARALSVARERGALTVAFTGAARGESGGPVGEASDIALIVPSKVIAEVQEIHLALGHLLCELVENRLAGQERGASRP